jgi:hypothetical protein
VTREKERELATKNNPLSKRERQRGKAMSHGVQESWAISEISAKRGEMVKTEVVMEKLGNFCKERREMERRGEKRRSSKRNWKTVILHRAVDPICHSYCSNYCRSTVPNPSKISIYTSRKPRFKL